MSGNVYIGVPVANLRPTPMTVGLRELGLERKEWWTDKGARDPPASPSRQRS